MALALDNFHSPGIFHIEIYLRQNSLLNVKNHTLKCMVCLVLEHAQDLFLLSRELN